MSDYIPQGLVMEILQYLPPTTLGKCMLVCKAWNKIIKSHTFISSHLQLSLSRPIPLLLLIRQSQQIYDIYSNVNSFPLHRIRRPRFPFILPIHSEIHFVGSLHGIVLFSHMCGMFHSIILWNPLIDKYVSIQNPNDSYLTLGFGFDSNKNDFKVVQIARSHQVELYSFNEDTWRVIDVSIHNFDRFELFSERQCFLNGNVHWIIGYVANDNTSVISLLMFNVEEEKFKNMELPPELVNVYHCKLKVIVIEGCLSVVNNSYDDWCDIWVMREYGIAESWKKTHIQAEIRDVFGLTTSSKVVLDKHPNILLQSFDINSQEMMDLHIQGPFYLAFDYTESLILLDK